MSEPKRASRLLLGAGALVLVLLLLLLGRRLSVSYGTPLTGCVQDHGTGGGLGLARWAKRLGFPVRALEVPIWEASGALESATGNCLVTMGQGDWSFAGEKFDDKNWHALQRWLAQGNALVVVTTSPGTLPEPFHRDLIEPLFTDAGEHRTMLSFWQPAVASEPQTHSIAALEGGTLTVTSDGTRMQLSADGGVGQVAPVTLAADDRGGVLFRIPVDAGAVYLLLDDFAWTNAGLDRGENARVLARILAREVRGGVLGVDEHRHGHGRAVSFLTYVMSLPGAPQFLGIGFLWSLFYFYGSNVRLQPAEAFAAVERRSAWEYIDAVARLHERARAASLVVEAVARRLRHLSRGPGELTSRAAELLQQAENYSASEARPARPAEAMDLVAELVHARKQLYGSRTLS